MHIVLIRLWKKYLHITAQNKTHIQNNTTLYKPMYVEAKIPIIYAMPIMIYIDISFLPSNIYIKKANNQMSATIIKDVQLTTNICILIFEYICIYLPNKYKYSFNTIQGYNH